VFGRSHRAQSVILPWLAYRICVVQQCCHMMQYNTVFYKNGVTLYDCVHQRWAWTLDILQDTCDFFGSGLDLDILFWKKLDEDRIKDIGLISITKFSWEWFKISQMMVAVFSLLWFLYSQCVLHSSQSMVISATLTLIFSGQVEVVSLSADKIMDKETKIGENVCTHKL